MHRTSQVCCPDFLHNPMGRRTFLKVGGLGLAGFGLPQLLRAEAGRKTERKATARSVILLFQFGGPSHLDTFDPKPNAPREIRGEFAVIPTTVPGIQVTEHLPRLARLTDKYALIRSVRHNRSAHNSGAYYSLTGREPLIDIVTANAAATDFPHPGSVVAYLGGSNGKVPPFVSLPTMIADGPFRTPGEFAGLLGKMYDPLWVLGNPNSPSFDATDFTLPAEVNVERVEDRRAILHELDERSRLADREAVVQGMDAYRARAMDLLTSPATKQAFALQEEPAAVRDRYGRTTYGQSVLLARRLIEAGVRFVTVYFSPGIGGWDTHKDNFREQKVKLLPQFDTAVSALVTDLCERGLQDEVLVMALGEFGRTPKINEGAGRDHWSTVFSVLLAGAGLPGGSVYGASDRQGAEPIDRPVTSGQLAATVFHALGIDPATQVQNLLGRPWRICDDAPATGLWS